MVNNVDPANPKVVGFIEILGNADITVLNDVLYADLYIDLVWFDISNPAAPIPVGRKEKMYSPQPFRLRITSTVMITNNAPTNKRSYCGLGSKGKKRNV